MQYGWLTFDNCGCPVVDEAQLRTLWQTNPDEALRQMSQLMADEPGLRVF